MHNYHPPVELSSQQGSKNWVYKQMLWFSKTLLLSYCLKYLQDNDKSLQTISSI